MHNEQAWQPDIREHPLISSFIGQWNDRGQLAWSIIEHEDGRVVFASIRFRDWRVVINNVHWEQDTLCFDAYHYCESEHPFNGVRNHIRFMCTDDPDVLQFQTEAPAIGKNAKDLLHRAD